jgi:hypothetical protein
MVVRSLCSAESEWEATIKGTEVPKVMSPANQGRRKGGNPGFFSLSISEKKGCPFSLPWNPHTPWTATLRFIVHLPLVTR